MVRSDRLILAVTLVLAGSLIQAPASAAVPPEPYRVATGLDGAVSAEHAALGDRIFWVLSGNSGTSSMDSDLWTSDGTAAGTAEFFDPNPGGFGRVNSLHQFGSGFVFSATDGEHGSELWYSDGTAAGTSMVTDLTVTDAVSTWLVDVGDTAVYLAADDGMHGRELYRWTGPGSAPQRFDINTTVRMTTDSDLVSQWRTDWTDSNPSALGMVGDTLLFTADQTIRTASVDEWGDHHVATSGTGEELWKIGPTGPPALVRDISQTDMWGQPDPRESTRFSPRTGTAAMGGSLYFLTDDTDDDSSRPELWRSNGTTAGTQRVATPRLAFVEDHWEFEPVTAGGKIFYQSWDGDWDGIWATSGSGEGQRVSPPGDGTVPVALGGGVVFGLQQSATGQEPWFSDGSSSILLRDLRPGVTASSPFPFVAWGTHAYFGANAGAGRDLYRTDGTVAGIERVADLPNVAGAILDGPMVFYGAENLLYFINSPDNDRNVDSELWVFDPARVVTAKSTTTILRGPTSVAYGAGGAVTISVSGGGGPPTGTVTIRDGTKALGTATLVAGRATFALPKGLALGAHSLTATYGGDAASASSVSAPVKLVVKAATKLTGRITDLKFGTKEKIRITVRLRTTPAILATGRMTFLVDGRTRVSASLAARHKNTLTLVSKPLARGTHRLQATFTNSPNAMDAKTGVVKITVVG